MFAQEVLEPLEHSVLDAAVRTLSSSAVTLLARLARMLQGALLAQMGQFGTLSSSDCHLAGPAGPYVAGGLVGPDESLKVLEPLEHSVLDHADPAGQHAVIQEVMESLEHSVLDHADPAGQHAVVREVLEPLEHSVLAMTLDEGPLEKMSDWEPSAHSVLDVTLDGRPWTVDSRRGFRIWNR